MLRHIVIWKLSDNLNENEKKETSTKIKTILEALKPQIKEIIEIKVNINELATSNTDIMLDSLFESEEALNAYRIHPEHMRAGEFIGSVTANRAAFDYFE